MEKARLKARQRVRTIRMAEMDVVDPDSRISVKRDGSNLGEVVLGCGSDASEWCWRGRMSFGGDAVCVCELEGWDGEVDGEGDNGVEAL
ncbi:putative acyl-activating enzyme 6 [Senna tora]|uniref:Putative acyl-activating enzyme 6 n=1 Tax=Senna tora TaxID=362788 RepID=A0A834WBR1_9FABA|nr:putative acyl-activating enzyme 6 [Senna tora]